MFEGYNGILLTAVKRAINKMRVFCLCSEECNKISKTQNENAGNVAVTLSAFTGKKIVFSYFSRLDSPLVGLGLLHEVPRLHSDTPHSARPL
jgi:hypothetical protein